MDGKSLARAKQEFQTVREQFFPRWDRERRWRIRQVADLNGAQGQVHTESRTIRITNLPEGDEGTLLLIHEIAHAVGICSHGKKWQARMEQAAKVAERMGRARLAGLLRKEIGDYRDEAIPVVARLVYQGIADTVAEDPDLTFFQVIDFLRRNHGMSRREFLTRFGRARRVFDREKREAEERARVRAKALAATGKVADSPKKGTTSRKDVHL